MVLFQGFVFSGGAAFRGFGVMLIPYAFGMQIDTPLLSGAVGWSCSCNYACESVHHKYLIIKCWFLHFSFCI